MVLFFRVLMVVLFLAIPQVSEADTEEEIRAVLAYYSDLWTSGDFEGIRAYYHSDYVRISPKGPVTSLVRVTDLKDILGEGNDQGELTFSEVTVVPLGDKHAVAYGKSSFAFKDGSSIDSWFTTTYVKTPLGWKALLTRD